MRCFGLLTAFWIALVALGSEASGQPRDPLLEPERAAERIATALTERLAHRQGWTERAQGAIDGLHAARIVKRPIVDDHAVIAKATAEALGDDVLRHLLASPKLRLEAISQEDIAERVQAIWRGLGGDTSRFDAEVAAFLKTTGAELELVGTIDYEAGQYLARYRIVTTGAPDLLASSPRVAVRLPDAPSAGPPVSLDAALRGIARDLIEQVEDMTLAQIEPIKRDRRLSDGTGRMLAERLGAALVQAHRAQRIGTTPLRVVPLEMSERELREGLETSRSAAVQRRPGHYRIDGAYYVHRHAVHLIISLGDAGGRLAIVERAIVPRSIPGLEPAEVAKLPFAELREDISGEFELALTTPRGGNPAYSVREYLELGVRVGRAAALYCFNVHDKGIARLFPNSVLRDPVLPANRSLLIPKDFNSSTRGAIRYPVDLEPGVLAASELIKCFALAAEDARRLPPMITQVTAREPHVVPLSADQLQQAFRATSNGRMSEAHLLIRIEREK